MEFRDTGMLREISMSAFIAARYLCCSPVSKIPTSLILASYEIFDLISSVWSSTPQVEVEQDRDSCAKAPRGEY